MTSNQQQGALKTMKARSIALFQSKELSDCSFRVGPTENQQVFEAHKLILSMASPVFETMFYGMVAEEKFPIDVADIEPESFAILMEYLYTDRINIGTFEEATTMCYVGQKYMLTSMVDLCVMCIKANLCIANVCRAYEIANLYEKTDLKDRCVKMITTGISSVLVDTSFVDINISTLVDIFNMDNLEINSELDLFNALERYVNANGPQPDDWSDSGEYRKLLKNIRFLSMTPKQFADGPGCSKLLQQHEKLAILMNISSEEVKDCPMPEGFSTSRNCRKPSKTSHVALKPQIMPNAFRPIGHHNTPGIFKFGA